MTFEGLDDDDGDEEEWIPMVETVDDQTHTHEEPSAQRLDKSPSRVAYSYSKPDKPNRPSQSNALKPPSVLRPRSTQSSSDVPFSTNTYKNPPTPQAPSVLEL